MSEEISLIGAGVSGLTTALVLQLLDYETKIYAEKTTEGVSDKNEHPEFSSLYPSASVIPHSVHTDRLKQLFTSSQSIFYELRKQAFPGVTIHKHYEVFEFKPDRPDYCSWMLNTEQIDEFDTDLPCRPDAGELYGWVFDCIFADWPLYLPALLAMYKDIGGTITKQKLEKDDIAKLPSDTVINCSGTGAPKLFDDPVDKQLLVRGHLLHKPDAPLITNADDEIISYNYTPKSTVYADHTGKPCDVYCYPRKDGWVLGGSRQTGILQENEWKGKAVNSNDPCYTIDNIRFPAQIIDLNREILASAYNHSLSDSDELSVSVGYRYIRSRENGLRIDSEQINGKTVYHNYGHGGAGVTLSWGCALAIARQICSDNSKSLPSLLIERMANSQLPA